VKTLLLPPRYTDDSTRLGQAASRAGWHVERLSSWHIPPLLKDEDISLYGEPLFAMHAAAELELALLETPYDWLARQPSEYLHRQIRNTTLADARRTLHTRHFVKPAMEKFLKAAVHDSAATLPGPDAASGNVPVLIAETVTWEIEFRAFILDRRAVALSPYHINGQLARADDDTWPASAEDTRSATDFLITFLSDARVELPPSIVLDIGRISDRGWAIVEPNPTWGSGIYGCDPEAVLRAVARATFRRADRTPNDQRWLIDHESEDFL
jgi:hypothetical protein